MEKVIKLLVLVDPALSTALVVSDLLGLEPESDFLLCRCDRVGAVDDISADLEEVNPNETSVVTRALEP